MRRYSIDVADARRAVTDGVIVTPTLVAIVAAGNGIGFH